MNIVITAGGTSERIDNVRKITNSSSGKLGMIIANTIINNHRDVDKIYYVCSSNAFKPSNEKIKIITVSSVSDLEKVVCDLLTNNKIDYFIHSMAVSDYAVDYVSTSKLLEEYINNHTSESISHLISHNQNVIQDSKISSYEQDLIIRLKKTKKIISIIKKISPNTKLFGFKLLDKVTKEELISRAIDLMDKNKCDLVVANDLDNIRSVHHKAYIIGNDYRYESVNNKEEIAKCLVKHLI